MIFDFICNIGDPSDQRIKGTFLFLNLLVLLFLQASGQDSRYKHYTTKDGLPSSQVYRCIQVEKGYMWFITDAGVSRFDGFYFKNFFVKDGLIDNDIIQIYQDRESRIWLLGFNGRLCYFSEDSIKAFNLD